MGKKYTAQQIKEQKAGAVAYHDPSRLSTEMLGKVANLRQKVTRAPEAALNHATAMPV